MSLLLDTHILLWSLLEPDKLLPAVAEKIEDPGNEIWISPISIWETLILAEKGRIVLAAKPDVWIKKVIRSTPLKEAPLTVEIAIQSRNLDLPHQDPADRFIAATSLVCGLTLVTADENILQSKKLSLLANRSSRS